MVVTKKKKIALAQEYKEMMQGSQLAVLAGYQGLNVSELTALRRRLQAAGIRFHVIKNTVARLALSEVGITAPDEIWQGPNALGVTQGDPAAAAKVFIECARDEPRLAIRAGFLGNQVIRAEDLDRLASLPSREVILGQLLAGMQAPLTGLVTVLSGVVRGLVNVLDARRRQLEEAAR